MVRVKKKAKPLYWVPDFMYVDWERPHLGGYLKGGDAGSWLPDLWTWLVKRFHVKTVLDVGCGEGQALEWFADHGCKVLGVDGIEQPQHPWIVTHDYIKGPYRPRGRYDLAWCCEFVEHVEEQYVPNFMATLEKANVVAMTHGLPGQGGHHHVNCQPPEYWVSVFRTSGFRLDKRATKKGRSLTPHGYFDWSGMIFVRA